MRSQEREQFLADVLCTGYEEGIGYWARAIATTRTADGEYVSLLLVDHLQATDDHDLNLMWNYDELDALIDAGKIPELPVHRGDIAKAIRRITTDSTISLHSDYVGRIAAASRDNDCGLLDSLDCDIIIQVAALGAVIYG